MSLQTRGESVVTAMSDNLANLYREVAIGINAPYPGILDGWRRS